jgi:two-component system cell cycle sensor histidine kinase/response regulator CckA
LLGDCSSLTLSGSSSRCHLEVDGDLWLARVDKTRIKQVLNNLLINASQAMPEGGHITASAKNRTLTEGEDPELPAGPYVVINVHDRGSGIPEHILPHIFKRNFTTKKTGNGLGLASSYHIVRGHEGIIRVHSTQNVGTEFSVFLPACPAGQLECEPQPVSLDSPLPAGCGCILVVDDQHVVRAAVKASVEALGYEADEASTGEEAIDRYRRRFHEGRPFHLVLMDRTLPGGHNGDDAMREIRHLDPFARVIASSGAIDADGDIDLRQLGYVSILPKPFDMGKLSHTLYAAASAELPA